MTVTALTGEHYSLLVDYNRYLSDRTDKHMHGGYSGAENFSGCWHYFGMAFRLL